MSDERRGEVWVGGGYRVLITSQRFDRVAFVRLNGKAKGTPVRCGLDQFLLAYSREVPPVAPHVESKTLEALNRKAGSTP